MTTDEVVKLQAERNMGDVHLLYIQPHSGGEGGKFWCAHTNEERDEAKAKGTYPAELESCDLHRWLVVDSDLHLPEGYYVVTPHQPDSRSEPLGAGPYDFLPLDAINPCAVCGWARTCGDPPGEDCHS